ncbi:prepilin-type N-terminal cleavage/methylation domain-containing protein [Clostridium sp. Marseille-P299]|uniref:prepilin-type N-terminal cleavage/methylation domain-containing protein n=1 Tax=Clostridium sp. Marseille-P299 TaxID=1805477 RepID=UPI00082F4296|nr:prepilin-type N-terminal cleavage/methylation domain-containing protein [Clostridium sp. Marseille-P299]
MIYIKNKNEMKCKNKKNAGFTLAELLIAVGILSILLSIGMVGVAHYQKSLKLMEMDATAREIFVAAQNHMTASKASGTWKSLEKQHDDNADGYFGSKMTEKPSDYPAGEVWAENDGLHEYYYIVYDGEKDSLKNTILETILPLGAIDEKVRSEGFYVIEYDYLTATVYGVFYTDDLNKCTYENDIMGANGLDKTNGRDNSSTGKQIRKNYKNEHGNVIIGYYGGAITKTLSSTELDPVEIQVDNADVLKVTITDSNYWKRVNGQEVKSQISVTVTGEESQASVTKSFEYDELGTGSISREEWWSAKKENDKVKYTLILDDITRQGGHFADIFPDLIPGENIIITVEVFSNQVLCKAVKSQAYTNSLFEANYEYTVNGKTASKVTIGNVRHLQNLSPEVSNLPSNLTLNNNKNINRIVDRAEQTSSIDWNSFMPNGKKENIVIYAYDGNVMQQKELARDKFYGITNLALIEYEGNGHQLSNFTLMENETGNVGLFSQIGTDVLPQTFAAKNLVLNNFVSVNSKNVGNAGTLVGTVSEDGHFTGQNITVINSTVKASGNGIAGGLVGELNNGNLENCAIYLTDDEVDATKITAAEKYELGAFNQKKNQIGNKFMVFASNGVAGGLVGKTVNTSIIDSFASVPVVAGDGGISGGLIGVNDGATQNETLIKNSYAGGYTKNGQYSEFFGATALGSTGIAGGFIGKDGAYNTVIMNCFSTLSVYGNLTGGFTGKIDAGVNTYTNCYSIGKVEGISGNSKRGAFIGSVETAATVTAKQCYFLKDSNSDLKPTISDVYGYDYDGMINAVYDESKSVVLSVSGRAGNDNENAEVYSYDQTLEAISYPFRLVNNTAAKKVGSEKVYYGDWPLKIENANEHDFDFGIIYYEKLLDDSTFYYHGWVSKESDNPDNRDNYEEVKTQKEGLSNGLELSKGKYVEEDGYLILLPEDVDLESLYYTDWGTSIKEIVKERKDLNLPEEFKGFIAYEFLGEASFNLGQKGTLSFYRGKQNEHPKRKIAYFSFTPYFADSVQPMKEGVKDTTYYIRSTRQLVNLQQLESFTIWDQAINNYFIQNMDISFIKVRNYLFSDSISKFRVKEYESQHYPDNSGTYTIQGMNVTMFGYIFPNTVVKGITLTDVQIYSTDLEIAALARFNEGIIEGCSIRSSINSPSGYESVVIEGYGKASGLVFTNQGTIRNSYMTGTVKGDSVSGFVDTNRGSIENCYVNGILTGITQTSGFLRYNNGGKVLNCFTIGSVESTGDSSISYAFGNNNDEGIIENCYSALFKLSGKQIYRFGTSGKNNPLRNCTWLDNNYIEGEVQFGDIYNLYEQGKPIDYDELAKYGTSPQTYKYYSGYKNADNDKKNTVYPFQLLSTEDAYVKMQFWGDWPARDTQTMEYADDQETDNSSLNAGLIYYELIDGKLYYHGYLTEACADDETPEYQEIFTPGFELTNGLLEESGKYVTEEGYMILIPKDKEVSTLGISFGNENTYKLENLTEKVSEDLQNQLSEIGEFEAYYVIQENIPQHLYEYQAVLVQIGNNLGQADDIVIDSKTARLSFQPLYGDTVKHMDAKQSIFYIRSPRHLNNIAKEESSASYTFIQSADITFVKGKVPYTNRGKSCDDYIFTESINNFRSNYESKTYKLEDNTYGYVIEALDKQLFQTIESESEIKGITLINTNASFAENNKGIIESCSIRPDVEGEDGYSKVQIKNQYGFLAINQGMIINCYVSGTVIGNRVDADVEGEEEAVISGFVFENYGLIESCYANVTVSTEDGEEVSGFCYRNLGTIKNSHSLGVAASTNTVYGFLGVADSSKEISNCYSAMLKLRGNKIYMFGKSLAGEKGNINNCRWLKIDPQYIQGDVQFENEIGTEASYEKLQTVQTDKEAITHKYNNIKYANTDRSNKSYPFELIATSSAYLSLEHWGDWPMQWLEMIF